MFVLIWATLLFCVRCSHADQASFPGGKHMWHKNSSVTLIEGNITAQAGLCVVIPCSFTTPINSTPKNLVWFHKCKQSCVNSSIIFHTNNKQVKAGFEGRVSLLEPDLSRSNCSIIINDLTQSDSGPYQLRLNGIKNAGDVTFPQRANISVTDLTQKPTVMIPDLTEGQQTTLTCTAPGLCSGSKPKITWMWRGAEEEDSNITGNITAFTENVTAVTQRHRSTLMFNVSAEHHGTEVTCKVTFTNNVTTEETVTLNVTYMKHVKITGNTSLEEGETLNLTCSVDSFPPSLITWTKLGFNKSLNNGTGSASLVVPNMTAEYSGQYICTAKHVNNTLTEGVNIKVKFFPRILNSSGCEVQAEVLTCVCISEGFPLPTIKWPLLENHTEYSVTIHVSNHTVSVSLTVSITDHNYSTVECVSTRGIQEAKENLVVIIKKLKKEDLLLKFLMTFELPHVIIAFLIGIFLSAAICCLVGRCHRNKQKSSGNMVEALEMGTTQAAPLIAAGDAVENGESHGQEAAGGGAGLLVADGNVEPREVEYSDINFSLLKRSSAGPEAPQQTTETEYAEIKNKDTEERRDNGGEDGDMLEGNEEEEVEVRIGEGEEMKQCMAAEEEAGEDLAVYSMTAEEEAGEEVPVYSMAAEEEAGEEVPVYSNVNKIMAEL